MHRLRSLWDEPRPAGARPINWRDWTLVGVVWSVAGLEGALRPDVPSRVLSVALLIVVAPALLWRRTQPLPAVTVMYLVTAFAPVVTHAQPSNLYGQVFLLLLPYSLLRWGSGRDIVIGCAVILGKSGLWLLTGWDTLGHETGEAAALVTIAAIGAALRYRAGARARELDQAKLVERERLARDLHDTVAHHVSAMAIRAQAGLATAPTQPEAATEALRLIEAEASRALAEMRAMVRVLRRDEPAELAPSPRITDLARLAGQARTGPVVDVEILGDVGDVPPSVETAIFRLAQESVTNARRHARHATRIEVRVAADDKSVHLRVSDDGDAGQPGTPGYGLIGMAERAGLLGGTCEAGPNPDRGWTVTAVLPRTGSVS